MLTTMLTISPAVPHEGDRCCADRKVRSASAVTHRQDNIERSRHLEPQRPESSDDGCPVPSASFTVTSPKEITCQASLSSIVTVALCRLQSDEPAATTLLRDTVSVSVSSTTRSLVMLTTMFSISPAVPPEGDRCCADVKSDPSAVTPVSTTSAVTPP